jgi:P2X purinoceptor 4
LGLNSQILFVFLRLAVRGGVISVSIGWNCDLDLNFTRTCLPKYSFRILDDYGWNFREAKYHEEHRRTLYKLYGMKVRIIF